jgi:hypothetical protein
MRVIKKPGQTTESDIWARLIRHGNFSKAVARGFLSLNFGDDDKVRMQELAQKNNEGKLSPAELSELDEYVKVGDILSLLHLKARRALGA